MGPLQPSPLILKNHKGRGLLAGSEYRGVSDQPDLSSFATKWETRWLMIGSFRVLGFGHLSRCKAC